jgi:hypothetical protein
MYPMRHSGVDDLSVSAAAESDNEMDSGVHAILKGELEPGERLLWAGRSEPVAETFGLGFFLFSAVAMILLLLGVVGIGSFLDARRHRHFFDESSIGVGLRFLGVACVIVIGLIGNRNNRRREFRRKANILYAVTDRRAIVWMPEPKGDAIRIRTVDRGQIQTLERVQRPNGSGDLIFSTWKGHSLPDPDYDYAWYSFGFRDIHNVRRVEQIVRNNLVSIEKMT